MLTHRELREARRQELVREMQGKEEELRGVVRGTSRRHAARCSSGQAPQAGSRVSSGGWRVCLIPT